MLFRSLYGTFVFGYDHDTEDSFAHSLQFAMDHGLFIAAFNHITPFPGTPLYRRLQREGRLLYDAWWLDERYRYGDVPFVPGKLSPERLARLCIDTRRAFYSWRGIYRRLGHPVNRSSPWALLNYLTINVMHQHDISGRNGLPLGDANWRGELLQAPLARRRASSC